jgi:SPOR domain
MSKRPRVPIGLRVAPEDERGLAMVAVLATALIVTVISIALVGLMNTDLTHASIQHAVARSFYIAQAGLAEAKVQVSASADPAAYTTPASGVTAAYGSGRFTYWVDAGPAAGGCGPGLKTLEVQGEVGFLGRTIWSRFRACAVGGTPFLAALFGVGRVQFQGAASRVYLAPYQVGTPGGGGSVGSFTEINFADPDVRVNALSEERFETVPLRDGNVLDYRLYGFPERPDYNPNAAADPAPWVLSIFGDIIKARPSTGLLPTRCGTTYACLTVRNDFTDIRDVADLRTANYVHHVYFNDIREERLTPLALNPEAFRTLATQNTANADLNRIVGLEGKIDSLYERMQFFRLMFYLVGHPTQVLRGPVYVNGTVELLRGWNLGGDSGNVTLAIAGDLIIDNKLTLTNRHDLSSATGRRLPGIVVFSAPEPETVPTEVCGGERVNGTGRLVMCEESTLIVDGLIYTQDGMAIERGATLDQIGAMYHDNHGTPNPSFSVKDGAVTLRFDPLALSVFGHGITIVSWQQLHGPGVAVPPSTLPPGTDLGSSASATATPLAALAARAQPTVVVSPPAPSGLTPGSSAAITPAHGAQHPNPGPAPVPSPAGVVQEARTGRTLAVLEGHPEFHVQAGAFRSREYADDLVRQLRTKGYTVTLVEGSLIRVRVGPPMSQQAAERLAANLRLHRFEATLIPTQ